MKVSLESKILIEKRKWANGRKSGKGTMPRSARPAKRKALAFPQGPDPQKKELAAT